MKTMNVKQQTSELFKQSAAPGVPVSLRKARENKTKLLVGLLMTVIFWSVPTLAQEKNELGLVIGGIPCTKGATSTRLLRRTQIVSRICGV